MEALFGVLGLLGFMVGLVWMIISLIRKKPKKVPGIVLVVGLVLFIVAVSLTPITGEVSDADASQQGEPSVTQEKPKAAEPPPVVVFDPAEYQNGITYDNLARNPAEYEYLAVAFNGEVVQVIDGAKEIQCRLAIDGDYDKMVLIAYKPEIIDSRVLEGDYITVYGTSLGIATYESTIGGQISIPQIVVKEIRY